MVALLDASGVKGPTGTLAADRPLLSLNQTQQFGSNLFCNYPLGVLAQLLYCNDIFRHGQYSRHMENSPLWAIGFSQIEALLFYVAAPGDHIYLFNNIFIQGA